MQPKEVMKWTLLGLCSGAAVGYLAQSEFGQKRRAAMARSGKKLFERAAQRGKKALQDSEHRLAGLAAHWWANINKEKPLDRVLEERIRSRMGRIVSHPRKIHVVCDHGVAILWGIILEDEASPLIEAVERIPGVTEVVDHLDIATPDQLPVGPANSLKAARDEIRLNWSPSRRLIVGASGAALAVAGLRRKDLFGNVLAVLGAGMVVRSSMKNHLRATFALSESAPGFELEKTIRINAPISDIFNFWADPQNYPKAFSHVAGIERLGENLYRWSVIGPAGIPIGWEGMITRTIPNTLVEWKSLPGSAIKNFGVAHFDPHYDASTRVHIRMFYRPPAGILGRFFAELFGADAGQVLDQDLKRLKYLFENGALVPDRKEVTDETDLLKTAMT